MEGKAGENKHKTPQIIPVEEAKHVKEKIMIQMTGKAAERSEPLPQQKKVIRNKGQGSLGSRRRIHVRQREVMKSLVVSSMFGNSKQ